MASQSNSTVTDTTEPTDASSICSDASTLLNGSVTSTLPDKYGFLGGHQYSRSENSQKVSRQTILKRERKWLHMLAHWQSYMTKNYKKVKERCHKGIPMSVRPKAWLYLCGGQLLLEKHPGEYERLIQMTGDQKWIDDIKKDLHRQFPLHEMFVSEDKPGQKELFNILKAYSIRDPEVGFCQAQAPVAAFLLLHMPSVQAFWCLTSICEHYLVDYYKPRLEVVQRDGDMLHGLLKRTCPAAYRHLVKYDVQPILYMTDWFLCCFTRTLPWGALLRMWDIFLCEGIKVLFKTALVIIAGCLGSSKSRKLAAGQCETLEILRNPPFDILTEDYLIAQIERLNLTEEDFQIEHERHTTRRKAAAALTSNDSGATSRNGKQNIKKR